MQGHHPQNLELWKKDSLPGFLFHQRTHKRKGHHCGRNDGGEQAGFSVVSISAIFRPAASPFAYAKGDTRPDFYLRLPVGVGVAVGFCKGCGVIGWGSIGCGVGGVGGCGGVGNFVGAGNCAYHEE
jgi:hypothetical protein